MKKLILSSLFILAVDVLFSQSDTLFFKSGKKIPCKITEISEFELKYKNPEVLDGPVYVINKNNLLKYTFANGITEFVVRDEMLVEGEHERILKNRRVIKIHPFSFVNQQVSMSYERVLKVGTNLDVEIGYNSDDINSKSSFNANFINAYNSGMYVKPGVKFFLGNDYSMRGLKYAHPLKGRYIKLELVTSYQSFRGLKTYIYPSRYSPQASTTIITTNMNVVAYGGMVNYGRQFILGNALTLEYYIGAGFTGINYSYTNPEYLNTVKSQSGNFNYYDYNARNISNFHGFIRTPELGLSFTGGFRLGYILPDQKKKQDRKPSAKD